MMEIAISTRFASIRCGATRRSKISNGTHNGNLSWWRVEIIASRSSVIRMNAQPAHTQRPEPCKYISDTQQIINTRNWVVSGRCEREVPQPNDLHALSHSHSIWWGEIEINSRTSSQSSHSWCRQPFLAITQCNNIFICMKCSPGPRILHTNTQRKIQERYSR